MRDPDSILVLGGINIDEIIQLDRRPDDDATALVIRRDRAFGGHGANCATAMARLGATVAIAGAVGADDAGDACLKKLVAEGVNVRQVARLAGERTGHVVIPQAPDFRFMMMDRGANDAVMARWTETVRWDDFGTIVFFDPPREVLLTGLAHRRDGQRLVWSPGGLWACQRADAPALANFDLVVFNRPEARQWFAGDVESPGFNPYDEDSKPSRPPEIVVTQGADGARMWCGGDHSHVPAVRAQPIDPTGAGDAFVAALVVAARLWIDGRPASRADRLRFANLCAALTVEHVGAQSAPSLAGMLAETHRLGTAPRWSVR